MILSREVIYAALWGKVARLPQFRTRSRRLRHWEDVTPDKQPALFQHQRPQTPHQTKGIPPAWNLGAEFYIYHHCGGNETVIPATILNELVDAVDQALAPDINQLQTLGGLVSHCWITGPVEYYEGIGALMEQSVVIIPIEIRVPDGSGPV